MLKTLVLDVPISKKVSAKVFYPELVFRSAGWELTQACVEDIRVVPAPLGTSHPISSFQIHSIGILEDILSHKVSWQVFCMGLIYNETTTRVGG